jgi:hypothetical protein
LDPGAPAEIVRSDRRSVAGLRVRSYSLAPKHIWIGDGMRLTTPARTALDIGRLLPQAQAVPILDALLHQTKLNRDDVWALTEKCRGMRGIRQSRIALARADGGAETPLQSELRLTLRSMCEWPIETQIPFYDEWGLVFTRVAMGWPSLKVAVECDDRAEGGDAEYRTWMLRHTATLESLGWATVWVTAPMMRRPREVFHRVHSHVLAARRRMRC